MAKKCKLIHINDGSAKTLENGNFHFVEEYEWAEKYLNRYLRDGYEIKHMIPEFSPAIQREGSYSFYKSGFTAYMEKEVPDDELAEDEDAGEDLNPTGNELDWDDSDAEDLLAEAFGVDEDWSPEDGETGTD